MERKRPRRGSASAPVLEEQHSQVSIVSLEPSEPPHSQAAFVKAEIEDVDYEAVRIANMHKNAEFLRTIGLQEIKATLDQAAVQRNSSVRRRSSAVVRRSAEALPQRRSSRVTSERLKVEIQEAMASGNIELVDIKISELKAKQEQQTQGSYEAFIESEARKRMTEDELLLRNVCRNFSAIGMPGHATGTDASLEKDAALKQANDALDRSLKSLFTFSGVAKASSVSKEKGSSRLLTHDCKVGAAEAYSKLICTDVAKLVEHRVTSAFIHPSADKLIVAAGDKIGNLSIWNATTSSENHLDTDIYFYTPHAGNVSNIFCAASCPERLFTASYDGTIRSLNLDKFSFTLEFCAPEDYDDIYFTDVAFSGSVTGPADGVQGLAYIAKSDGSVSAIDMRASSRSYSWTMNAHPTKINAVQIHPMNENVLLCAGACTLSLHDIRRATGKSVSRDKALLYENTAAHSKSICSAGISPDGTVLVTLSSDNTMKLWTGDFCSKADGIRCAQSMRKNNHTGRWLSTFRHCFDPKYPNNFLVGSMELPRRMEMYSLHSSLTAFDHLCSLRAEDLKSVCSRNALHPTRNIVVGGNSSGRVHLFQ